MARRIVIVGGGVIGASVAWHLADRGLGDIVLLERDRLGSGTTWHSAGNITWRFALGHDAPVLGMFRTIERLTAETGQDTGWLWTGRLFVALTRGTRDGFAHHAEEAARRGYAARWLEPAEAQRLNPLIEPSVTAGIWFNPFSGRLNPADLTAAFAKGARMKGARIEEGTVVERLTTRSGRIIGVETSRGPIAADVVVVAAGLWSRNLLTPVGSHLAQWPCEHMYLIADVSPPLDRQTPSFVAPDCLAYGREEVGSLLIGFFDEDAIPIAPDALPEPFSFTLLAPRVDKIAPYFEQATALFPALAKAPVQRFINGPETFTPDGRPLIGRVDGIENLLVASAMNSAGVTWSAMAGTLIAELIEGGETTVDPRPYAPGRFGDRSADAGWVQAQASASVSGGYRKQNVLP
jgi:4-methylaminobutanoate oxidase (formaldehyde-forming)